MTANKKSRMLVGRWAAMVYGEYAPSPYALRCWILRGKIDPAPKKVSGKWFVHPSARYKDIGSEAGATDPGTAELLMQIRLDGMLSGIPAPANHGTRGRRRRLTSEEAP